MRVSDAIDDALELLDRAQQVAEDSALDRELSEIHYYRGSLYFPRGDIEGCIEQHGFALDSDFFVARGRALAAYGRGKRDRQLMDAIEQIRTEAKRVGFRNAFDSIAP